jgi:hypothetical protein
MKIKCEIEINPEDVKEILRSFGYSPTESDNFLIDFLSREVAKYALDFCNILRLPQELYEDIIETIAAQFLTSKIGKVEVDDLGNVSPANVLTSIKEGDTQVSYGTRYGSGVSGNTLTNSILSDIENRLTQHMLKFRRMSW